MSNSTPKSVKSPLRLSINVEDTIPVICSCGHPVFEPGVVLRYLGAIQSPNGQPTLVEAQVLICSKCGSTYTREDMLKAAIAESDAKLSGIVKGNN